MTKWMALLVAGMAAASAAWAQPQQILFTHVVDAGSVDKNAPAVGTQESERQFEDDGFASTAGPQDDPHARVRHLEADVAEHDVIVEGERHVLEYHSW